jgi:zinc transporter
MTSPAFEPFDTETGLILATRLPGAKGDFDDQRRDWTSLAGPTEPPPLWIHLDRTRQRAQSWVRTESGLDALVAESLLAEETRPRVQQVGEGFLVILRGVNYNPGAEPDELIALRIWLEPTRIITLRQFRFQTIAHLRARAQQGEAPDTSGSFLAALTLGLAERLAPSVENLEEILDEIEDEMLDTDANGSSRRAQLATVRRQAISYRRYLVPQRDTLVSLSTVRSGLISERDQAEIRVAAEQVARVCEALEEVRDRAAVTQDEIRARHEARVGRTLYFLTIIATIALPLGLITGLLGINVGGLPLVESNFGFLIVCGILVLLAGVELAIFKHMRWL